VAGQVLLTLADTEERRRYLNARATLFTLLRHKAVPVINENDTVATSEIRYGDNDRLAARVSSMVSGDCLVLLSDVDGLYTAAPGQAGATLIPGSARPHAGDRGDGRQAGVGRRLGGMATKLEAARIATGAGADMVIASGKPAASAAGHPRWRALHLVRVAGHAGGGAQALDRRLAGADRQDRHRRGRRDGAGRRERACCRPA
jgi:glutamate 5-kinase